LYDTEVGLGILRGFRQDVANGSLRRIEDLVSASVFSGLLAQAQYLLEQGYNAPAAGLAGAVLERELRALCERRGFTVRSGDGLSALNQKLVSAVPPAYNSIKAKKIEVWTKIRNDADHGHFESLNEQDVRDMIAGVENLLGDLL
jgi:hypothetical protein